MEQIFRRFKSYLQEFKKKSEIFLTMHFSYGADDKMKTGQTNFKKPYFCYFFRFSVRIKNWSFSIVKNVIILKKLRLNFCLELTHT